MTYVLRSYNKLPTDDDVRTYLPTGYIVPYVLVEGVAKRLDAYAVGDLSAIDPELAADGREHWLAVVFLTEGEPEPPTIA